MQERFIKIQLTDISKCCLKFNSKFPNKIIYAVRSKCLHFTEYQIKFFICNN